LEAFQLVVADIEKCRHSGGIDFEAFGYELIIGAEGPQAQPNAIGPRKRIQA
jgi:hypothetical protein